MNPLSAEAPRRAWVRTGVVTFIVAGLLAAGPASAAVSFGAGAYGGYQWPIAQDDAEPGGLFGLKAKVGLLEMLDLEPNLTWIQNGDAETDAGGTLPAPDVISYALNANLWLGPVFYLTGGIGWASVDLPQTGSLNKFAGNFGFGVEIPVGPVTIDISPRALVINTESGASRKHGLLMAGLNYRF